MSSVKNDNPVTIVVFAQVPPPEHGQSRMVKLALETLREEPRSFTVHHINARFSENLDDVGEGTFRKIFPLTAYLAQAVFLRFRLNSPLLYYVPGPAKWSPVLRDWVVLSVLRCFYSRVLFHWHAINPLFPALRSSPTAFSGASRKKQIPSSDFLSCQHWAVAEAVHKVDCRPDPANQGLTGGLHKRPGKPCLVDYV